MSIEREFIPYEQALALKELGFDEPCFGYYVELINPQEGILVIDKCENCIDGVLAPTFSQSFRWLREKYDSHHMIKHNNKYVGIAYFSTVNFSIDEFDTYEEAELECLKKLIEIVKNK